MSASSSGTVHIDGRPAGSDTLAFDRALHYGDGLFETLAVREGKARFLDLHSARLAAGCVRLGIPCDAAATLREAATDLDGDGTLKVIVTRGDALARGYGTSGTEKHRVLRFWYPGAPPKAATKFDVVVLGQRWGENAALAGLKHLNRLEQVLSRRELAPTGADEGLVGSSTGELVSGTMGNVFLALDGRWLTPRVDRCGIAGVLRSVVLREARRLGIDVSESRIPVSRVSEVTAAFFTNVRLGVRPVTRLDGRPLQQDDAVASLARRIEALDA